MNPTTEQTYELWMGNSIQEEGTFKRLIRWFGLHPDVALEIRLDGTVVAKSFGHRIDNGIITVEVN